MWMDQSFRKLHRVHISKETVPFNILRKWKQGLLLYELSALLSNRLTMMISQREIHITTTGFTTVAASWIAGEEVYKTARSSIHGHGGTPKMAARGGKATLDMALGVLHLAMELGTTIQLLFCGDTTIYILLHHILGGTFHTTTRNHHSFASNVLK